MSAVLRHAARKLGGSVAQRAEAAVAEGRGRLVTRRLYSTEESMTQGKKNLKDASDQVGATPGGFNWRQIPFASISQETSSLKRRREPRPRRRRRRLILDVLTALNLISITILSPFWESGCLCVICYGVEP
ncbi:unnamed protein product [Alopecurus aequalis]